VRRVARRALAPAAALCALALALGGCGGTQSALDPQSPPARDISTLFWWMTAAAAVVFAGALGFIVLAWLTRRRRGAPLFEGREFGMVLAFGMGIPLVAVVALFVIGNFVVLPSTDAPAAATTRLTVQVIGRQWFWEVRYPGTGVVTANEIHIPARTRVNVIATTADVIHSFWVPQLNRKIDMIPGRRNRVLIYAPRPGRYRGQCAEFCGPQHAHMALTVYADEPADYRAWLARNERTAATPATPQQQAGRRVFEQQQCASCHAIRGTPARGAVGPDLTHLGERRTLAALVLRNTPRELAAWIRDPQRFKPGNHMPALDLDAQQLRDVVAYLRSLR
jgi:cytochrome c oxidase subunit II